MTKEQILEEVKEKTKNDIKKSLERDEKLNKAIEMPKEMGNYKIIRTKDNITILTEDELNYLKEKESMKEYISWIKNFL